MKKIGLSESFIRLIDKHRPQPYYLNAFKMICLLLLTVYHKRIKALNSLQMLQKNRKRMKNG